MRLRASLVLLFSLAAWPAAATPIVSVQPATTTVNAGDTFALDVFITGAVDLYAYQFDLGFNPLMLSATSIVEDSFLASGGSTTFLAGTISNPSGTISFTADTLDTAIFGVTGSGKLATVNFLAVGPGTSLVNPFNVTLLDSSLSGLTDTLQSGSVTVTGSGPVVPEPSTLILITTGMAGLYRRRRRRE